MTREVLQQALEALEEISSHYMSLPKKGCMALAAIEEALAQPEQEPVALETVYETIIQWDEGGGKRSRRELARRIVALYTTPPQRTWQGLTEDEINEVLGGDIRDEPSGELEFVRAIEAKLKEKNRGHC